MLKRCYTYSKYVTICQSILHLAEVCNVHYQGVKHFLLHIVAKVLHKASHKVLYKVLQNVLHKVSHIVKCRLAVCIKGVSGVNCLPAHPAVQVLIQPMNPGFLPQRDSAPGGTPKAGSPGVVVVSWIEVLLLVQTLEEISKSFRVNIF